MATEKELRQAKIVFDTLCEMMDNNNWKYDAVEEDLMIRTGAGGDDLPIHIRIHVEPERQLVTFLSEQDFQIGEGHTIDMALAVTAINYKLVDGSFDYNPLSDALFFRVTTSYRESLLGHDLFEYMLFIVCKTVDDYNDKLAKIADGSMSLMDLIKALHE